MSVELIREAVRIKQVTGRETSQTVVENDIIVPDVKPDMVRILHLDGDVFVKGTEVIQDKILINGSIAYKILYLSDDPGQRVKGITAGSDFSCGLDLPNARSGAKCRVKCEIEHSDYEILNGRKINVKSVVRVNGMAFEEKERDIVSSIASVDDVQMLRENISVNSFLGDNRISHTISESFEVPAGKPTVLELLRNDVKITGKDARVTDNKVLVKGDLNVTTLYIGDDENRSIQVMEHEVPFTQFIDLPGMTDDSGCEAEFAITGFRFEPAEDGDGELRLLNGEVDLSVCISGYSKKLMETIEDAYSPKVRLNLEKEQFSFEDALAEIRGQAVLKELVVLPSEDVEINEVLNVLSKPALVEYRLDDDRVVVDGVVNNTVLYSTNNEDQPVSAYSFEIPFKHSLDLKGVKPGMDCDIDLDIEHCNYSMSSSNEVEIRLAVGVGVRASQQVTLPLTARITEQLAEDRKLAAQPSIVVYFAKPGDNLWKVAKKYFTTVDDIQRINNLTEQSLTPGQQIIITKRIV